MGKYYSHLTYNDRLQIEKWIIKGYKVKEIADLLDKSEVTIYNELKRATYVHTNSDLTEEIRYNPEQAHRIYRQNLKAKGPGLKIDKDLKLARFIESKILKDKYSPQAIIYLLNNENFDIKIKSYTTIYSYIRKEIFETLTLSDLPRRNIKKKRKKKVVQKRATSGTSIEKRPDSIDERKEFGHWEMDCVVGKNSNKKTLLVLTERKTRYQIIEVLKVKNTEEVRKALNRLEKQFKSKFYSIFNTITVDNGSEFSDFESMEKALYRVGKRTEVYYCHPYTPSERGSNENQNLLIRRHLPKGTDFDKVISKKKVKDIEAWMNDYPRNIFKGKSSKILFEEEIEKLLSG